MTDADKRTQGPKAAGRDFIRAIIASDIEAGKHGGRVHTRFPPEPNAHAHLGHAGAALLNFNLAKDFGGKFNLRFDDTNPLVEKQEYVDAIIEDLAWIGVDWEDRLCFASDYFEQMCQYAVDLVKKGKAYVDDQTPDQIRERRGTLTTPGSDSPWRDRPIEQNLDLFERMKGGEFPNGARVLRAKIDMAHPNVLMRDPVIYRIIHAEHYRRGDAWCIYPTYDWAHGLEDSIEGITHSCCSIEFEVHRPVYDWFLDALGIFHPQQIEFARWNVPYTVMSKRYLSRLINEGLVRSWDDPRLPTIRGMRRRGYTPEAIQAFFQRAGVSKTPAQADLALLEHCVREHLNKVAPRVMAVLKPLKVVLENYRQGETDWLEAVNNPEDPSAGARKVPFSKTLFIERDDFMEDPPRKFYRLAPGREVRLRYAYFVKCVDVVKDDRGEVVELRCTYDPATRGGDAPDGRKVKATLHWVSAEHALPAEARLYSNLFTKENPLDAEEGKDFTDYVNPDSLETLEACRVEPSLADFKPGDRCQFERLGYFSIDPETTGDKLVVNRIVTLRDTWARIQKRGR